MPLTCATRPQSGSSSHKVNSLHINNENCFNYVRLNALFSSSTANGTEFTVWGVVILVTLTSNITEGKGLTSNFILRFLHQRNDNVLIPGRTLYPSTFVTGDGRTVASFPENNTANYENNADHFMLIARPSGRDFNILWQLHFETSSHWQTTSEDILLKTMQRKLVSTIMERKLKIFSSVERCDLHSLIRVSDWAVDWIVSIFILGTIFYVCFLLLFGRKWNWKGIRGHDWVRLVYSIHSKIKLF